MDADQQVGQVGQHFNLRPNFEL